jgi:hypothetical protein
LSKCGTAATGIAAIGTAHGTGIAGTTTAQGFTSTSGRGATITIDVIGVADNRRLTNLQCSTGSGRSLAKSEGDNDMRYTIVHSLAGAALLLGAGLATAQTTPPTTPQSPPPAATKPDASKITLTEEQAKSWIAKPVFSSDGKELGEVAAFKRAADNTVLEMHADIGGFLGFGRARVGLTPAQFKLQNDRVILSLTAEQAKALPKVKN